MISCCILFGRGGESILDVIPRRNGALVLKLRRVVRQAAHTLNNPQV